MADTNAESKNFLNTMFMILAFMGGVIVTSHWYMRNKQDAGIDNAAVSTAVEEEVSEPTESTPAAVSETKTTEELIRDAFAEKYEKSVEEVNVVVGESTGEYAKGTVSFLGEIGGGWFLAAKTEEGWVVVADGNGTVMCEDIADYDFPVAMVPECWDEATQTLVER